MTFSMRSYCLLTNALTSTVRVSVNWEGNAVSEILWDLLIPITPIRVSLDCMMARAGKAGEKFYCVRTTN